MSKLIQPRDGAENASGRNERRLDAGLSDMLSAMTREPTLGVMREQSRQISQAVADAMPTARVILPDISPRSPIRMSPVLAPMEKPDRIPDLIASQGSTNRLLSEQNAHLSRLLELQIAATNDAKKSSRLALWIASVSLAVAIGLGIAGIVIG